jgi:hypothetical protein
MAKLAKHGRRPAPLPSRKRGAHAVVRRPLQIVLHRLQQGCYGICAGGIVAILAAMLGEHPPADRARNVTAAIALLAGAMGLLIEVFESRSSAGGKG